LKNPRVPKVWGTRIEKRRGGDSNREKINRLDMQMVGSNHQPNLGDVGHRKEEGRRTVKPLR